MGKPIGQSCANCRFFIATEPNDPSPPACHKRGPKLFMLHTAPPPGKVAVPGQQQMGMQLASFWPPVRPDGWCGEWEIDQADLQ